MAGIRTPAKIYFLPGEWKTKSPKKAKKQKGELILGKAEPGLPDLGVGRLGLPRRRARQPGLHAHVRRLRSKRRGKTRLEKSDPSKTISFFSLFFFFPLVENKGTPKSKKVKRGASSGEEK